MTVDVGLTVNGAHHELKVDPRTTLLDLLREHLGLTGTKKGCDHGQCGACTVLVDGVRNNSCLNLAASCDERDIVTIEGLGTRAACIHCRPPSSSMTASSAATARRARSAPPSACSTRSSAACPGRYRRPNASTMELADDRVRERMSGNICRCAAYPNIVAAILDAGGKA